MKMTTISTDQEVTSLIKWPGGKAKEYLYIKDLIPEYDRYIEPFFGGGAIYFALGPQKAIINDFSGDLMDLYRFLKGDYKTTEFVEEIRDYVQNWQKIPKYIVPLEERLADLFYRIQKNDISTELVTKEVASLVESQRSNFNGLFSLSFSIDSANLERQIIVNISSKLVRMIGIQVKHGILSREDIDKNIETAFRSGFYMHFRDLLNKNFGKGEVSAAKYTANYYFIREFCYGAMFRYNSAGKFNVPYGGIAYNRKDFGKKVEYILSNSVRSRFKNTIVENGDFEHVLKKHEVGQGDFVFFDPPYDTDFSDYDNNGFGMSDHKRLADFIHNTKAKCMLIIKETPFILSLYQNNPKLKIESFDKTYMYNVKGRNDRNANHLVIYNYDIHRK